LAVTARELNRDRRYDVEEARHRELRAFADHHDLRLARIESFLEQDRAYAIRRTFHVLVPEARRTLFPAGLRALRSTRAAA
jgi:hypothetical protein